MSVTMTYCILILLYLSNIWSKDQCMYFGSLIFLVHAFGNKVEFSVKCTVIGEMVGLINCMQTKCRTFRTP
jgi:hypothetical protein